MGAMPPLLQKGGGKCPHCPHGSSIYECIPYLVCVLCVQEKADWQGRLADYFPATSERSREYLEQQVRNCESLIQHYQKRLAKCQADLGSIGEMISITSHPQYYHTNIM